MGWILVAIAALILWNQSRSVSASLLSPQPQAQAPVLGPAKTISGNDPWTGDLYYGTSGGGIDVAFQVGGTPGGVFAYTPANVLDVWEQNFLAWVSLSRIKNPAD